MPCVATFAPQPCQQAMSVECPLNFAHSRNRTSAPISTISQKTRMRVPTGSGESDSVFARGYSPNSRAIAAIAPAQKITVKTFS